MAAKADPQEIEDKLSESETKTANKKSKVTMDEKDEEDTVLVDAGENAEHEEPAISSIPNPEPRRAEKIAAQKQREADDDKFLADADAELAKMEREDKEKKQPPPAVSIPAELATTGVETNELVVSDPEPNPPLKLNLPPVPPPNPPADLLASATAKAPVASSASTASSSSGNDVLFPPPGGYAQLHFTKSQNIPDEYITQAKQYGYDPSKENDWMKAIGATSPDTSPGEAQDCDHTQVLITSEWTAESTRSRRREWTAESWVGWEPPNNGLGFDFDELPLDP
jgi:hypothetical protein